MERAHVKCPEGSLASQVCGLALGIQHCRRPSLRWDAGSAPAPRINEPPTISPGQMRHWRQTSAELNDFAASLCEQSWEIWRDRDRAVGHLRVVISG